MKFPRNAFKVASILLALAGPSLARTWTSSDGKNSFEADFVSATATEVTVRRANKEITFGLDKMSEADRTYVREEAGKMAAGASGKADAAKLLESAIPKALSRKLVKLDAAGKKYESFDLGDGVVPKYYLVYFSASW